MSRPRWIEVSPRSALPDPRHLLAGALGVGDELAVDDVGQTPLQAPQGLHRCLAGGELASVVGAAFGVVTDLHDRRDVQDVVHPPVPRT